MKISGKKVFKDKISLDKYEKNARFNKFEKKSKLNKTCLAIEKNIPDINFNQNIRRALAEKSIQVKEDFISNTFMNCTPNMSKKTNELYHY